MLVQSARRCVESMMAAIDSVKTDELGRRVQIAAWETHERRSAIDARQASAVNK